MERRLPAVVGHVRSREIIMKLSNYLITRSRISNATEYGMHWKVGTISLCIEGGKLWDSIILRRMANTSINRSANNNPHYIRNTYTVHMHVSDTRKPGWIMCWVTRSYSKCPDGFPNTEIIREAVLLTYYNVLDIISHNSYCLHGKTGNFVEIAPFVNQEWEQQLINILSDTNTQSMSLD